MIITLSGSQGQGKSTVLASLEAAGYGVIPNKTARSILSDWGKTLEEVYSDKPLTVAFHEEIIKRHDELCSRYYSSNDVMFIERSYADIFSYALAVLGPYNQYSQWLNEFYDKCSQLQSKFSAAIYLTGRDYTPEVDGVRSVNVHFTRAIDLSIQRYLKEFRDATQTHKVLVVNTPDHDKRVEEIDAIIKLYFGE